MLFKLFLCFTLIPMVELFILIQMGSVIGGINTILLVIASGFFGAWLARMEGMQTMFKVRTALQQGRMPTEDLTDALIIYLLYPLGATATAVGFILAENTYATLIGYLYERVWTHIKWGIKVRKGDEKL